MVPALGKSTGPYGTRDSFAGKLRGALDQARMLAHRIHQFFIDRFQLGRKSRDRLREDADRIRRKAESLAVIAGEADAASRRCAKDLRIVVERNDRIEGGIQPIVLTNSQVDRGARRLRIVLNARSPQKMDTVEPRI